MLLCRLLYWKIKDFVKGFKNRKEKQIHLFGIYGFFGLPGQGKTLSMTAELMGLRAKYGDDIYIFTNYGFKQEDKP